MVMVLTNINAPSAGAGYLYALRNVTGGMNQIFGFQVNELNGTLTPLPGFPINAGGNGSSFSSSEQLSYDPTKRQLYAINDGSNTISAYSVNPRTGVIIEKCCFCTINPDNMMVFMNATKIVVGIVGI
jgi:6-phosphogluconolactonase (cycloisomerase 2 family)